MAIAAPTHMYVPPAGKGIVGQPDRRSKRQTGNVEREAPARGRKEQGHASQPGRACPSRPFERKGPPPVDGFVRPLLAHAYGGSAHSPPRTSKPSAGRFRGSCWPNLHFQGLVVGEVHVPVGVSNLKSNQKS